MSYGSTIKTDLDHVEIRLKMIAEGGKAYPNDFEADKALEIVGLIRNGELTEAGIAYHLARLVARNDDATAAVLGGLLRKNVVVNTFCGSLWSHQKVPESGAISLLKRLTAKAGMVPEEVSAGDWLAAKAHGDFAKLWLDLMNLARLIVYDSDKGYVRILYNPNELMPQEDAAERERVRGYVLDPQTPYTNRLALKKMIGGAQNELRWYEHHMTAKVLEVLDSDLVEQKVTTVRLLSGPEHIDSETKDLFKRFRKEMKSQRQIDVEWRVLTNEQARARHGRFFITEGFSRNLPPLNLILAGTVDEILPSEMTEKDFDEWWGLGQDIATYPLSAKAAT